MLLEYPNSQVMRQYFGAFFFNLIGFLHKKYSPVTSVSRKVSQVVTGLSRYVTLCHAMSRCYVTLRYIVSPSCPRIVPDLSRGHVLRCPHFITGNGTGNVILTLRQVPSSGKIPWRMQWPRYPSAAPGSFPESVLRLLHTAWFRQQIPESTEGREPHSSLP